MQNRDLFLESQHFSGVLIQHVLRKRNQIIGKVKSKYWVQIHEFGVNTPKYVSESKALMMRMATNFGGIPYENK